MQETTAEPGHAWKDKWDQRQQKALEQLTTLKPIMHMVNNMLWWEGKTIYCNKAKIFSRTFHYLKKEYLLYENSFSHPRKNLGLTFILIATMNLCPF